MTSIRRYDREIRVCASCGQPCYLGPTEGGLMWQHFSEQWDGVLCPWFPMAGRPIVMDWSPDSLKQVQAEYPDTYPR